MPKKPLNSDFKDSTFPGTLYDEHEINPDACQTPEVVDWELPDTRTQVPQDQIYPFAPKL